MLEWQIENGSKGDQNPCSALDDRACFSLARQMAQQPSVGL